MKPKYIINPIFISSLLILLINDLYLKYTYYNWITGKLSDVFGLIVFALFLTTFAQNYKKSIFIGTAILFSFWKTPYSQPIIDFWNSLQIIQFERTIDYTDIFCILILLAIYKYVPLVHYLNSKIIRSKIVIYPLYCITFFLQL